MYSFVPTGMRYRQRQPDPRGGGSSGRAEPKFVAENAGFRSFSPDPVNVSGGLMPITGHMMMTNTRGGMSMTISKPTAQPRPRTGDLKTRGPNISLGVTGEGVQLPVHDMFEGRAGSGHRPARQAWRTTEKYSRSFGATGMIAGQGRSTPEPLASRAVSQKNLSRSRSLRNCYSTELVQANSQLSPKNKKLDMDPDKWMEEFGGRASSVMKEHQECYNHELTEEEEFVKTVKLKANMPGLVRSTSKGLDKPAPKQQVKESPGARARKRPETAVPNAEHEKGQGTQRSSFIRQNSASTGAVRPRTAVDTRQTETVLNSKVKKSVPALAKSWSIAESMARTKRAGNCIEHEDKPPEQEIVSLNPRMMELIEKMQMRDHVRLSDPDWAGKAYVIYSSSERKSKKQGPNGKPLCGVTFQADFESANLRRVTQVGPTEFDLTLMADTQTSRHMQWFYFQVSGIRTGIDYTFNIVNLCKSKSLYNEGLRPLTYSKKRLAQKGLGWVRSCKDIAYYKSSLYYRKLSKVPFRTLTFTYTGEYNSDTVSFAHCYPYTTTQLKQDVETVMTDPDRMPFIDKTTICKSPGGVDCTVLDITEFRSTVAEMAERKGIIISARCHPGETPSSYMMRGILRFLTGQSEEASWLRMHYVFRLAPMLNPDGVVCGNTRCTLNGHDLNRHWDRANVAHSPLDSFKDNFLAFHEDRKVVLSIDLHAHSRRCNVFSYGCTPKTTEFDGMPEGFERVFPFLLGKECEPFQPRQCTYNMQASKQATSRIVLHRELQLRASYTVEASFLGGDVGKFAERHYTSTDYENIGINICTAIRKYCHQDTVTQTLNEVDTLDEDIAGDSEDDASDYSSEGESDDDADPEEVNLAQIERMQRLGRTKEAAMLPNRESFASDTVRQDDISQKQTPNKTKKKILKSVRPKTSLGTSAKSQASNAYASPWTLASFANDEGEAVDKPSASRTKDKRTPDPSTGVSRDELDLGQRVLQLDLEGDSPIGRAQSSPEHSQGSKKYFEGFGNGDDETAEMLIRIKNLKTSMTTGATELEALQARIQRYDGYTNKMLATRTSGSPGSFRSRLNR